MTDKTEAHDAESPDDEQTRRSSHGSTFAFTDEHVAYVEQYGGMCRDCADERGVCPGSGLPCGQSRKAIKHVLEAIQYGVRNGFVSSPVNT